MFSPIPLPPLQLDKYIMDKNIVELWSSKSHKFWEEFDKVSLALMDPTKGDPTELSATFVEPLIKNAFPRVVIEGYLFLMAAYNIRFHRTLDTLFKSKILFLAREVMEHVVRWGSTEMSIHTCLASDRIDDKRDVIDFLRGSRYYSPIYIGNYLIKGKNDAEMAKLVYRTFSCDPEFIDAATQSLSFHELAKYALNRKSVPLWNMVLSATYTMREELIPQVLLIVGNPTAIEIEKINQAVIAFEGTKNPKLIFDLLEKVVFGNLGLQDNDSWNTSFLIAAITKSGGHADEAKVMEWVGKLRKKFDGEAVGRDAVTNYMYKVASTIFREFDMNAELLSTLLKGNDIDQSRAVNEPNRTEYMMFEFVFV